MPAAVYVCMRERDLEPFGVGEVARREDEQHVVSQLELARRDLGIEGLDVIEGEELGLTRRWHRVGQSLQRV